MFAYDDESQDRTWDFDQDVFHLEGQRMLEEDRQGRSRLRSEREEEARRLVPEEMVSRLQSHGGLAAEGELYRPYISNDAGRAEERCKGMFRRYELLEERLRR